MNSAYALHSFVLSRYPFSADEWRSDRRKMFSCGSKAAILGGSWDLLRVHRIESDLDDASGAPKPDVDELLTERRIIHGLGPIESTASFHKFEGSFEGLAKDYTFLAYVEVRIRQWPFERAAESDASVIRATAKALRNKLVEVKEKNPQFDKNNLESDTYFDGEFAIFECLGHSDLIVLFCSNYIGNISRMFLEVRRLHMKEVWDADTELCAMGLEEKYHQRHIVEGTLTSFGFFCESVDKLEEMGAHLRAKHGAKQRLCNTVPTVLCALRPGHESTVEQVRDGLLLPLGAQGSSYGRIQVITGIYDLRLSYVFDRKDQVTEADVFEWVTNLYHRLFNQAEGADNRRIHVRNIHTSWGFDPNLGTLEQASDKDSQGQTAPWESLTSSVDLCVGQAFSDLMQSLEVLRIHSKTLQDLLDRYDSAARSPLLARYLADVHSFLLRFKDALLDDSRPELQEKAVGRIHPHDIELLLRRLAFVIVGRLSGAGQHGESEVAFGAGMTRQKVALALNCVAEEVRLALGEEDGREPAILVGFSVVGRARTTRWHWRADPQLVLIELPVTNDIHTPLYSVIHEVTNVIELRGVNVPALHKLLLDRLASSLAKRIHSEKRLQEAAIEDISWQPASIERQIGHALSVVVGSRPSTHKNAAFAERVRSVIHRYTSPEGLLGLLAEARIVDGPVSLGTLGEVCRIAAEARDEMDSFERLCGRLRADIATAHLCGWTRYFEFLVDDSIRTGNTALDYPLKVRASLLYHVAMAIGCMARDENIRLLDGDNQKLIDFLAAFAQTFERVLEQSRHRLPRTYHLCNELKNANGSVHPDIFHRLFQGWVHGWLEPMQRERNRISSPEVRTSRGTVQ